MDNNVASVQLITKEDKEEEDEAMRLFAWTELTAPDPSFTLMLDEPNKNIFGFLFNRW